MIGNEPASVTVDFAQVSFIDSSGLGVLVGALKRVREANPDATLRVIARAGRGEEGVRHHRSRRAVRPARLNRDVDASCASTGPGLRPSGSTPGRPSRARARRPRGRARCGRRAPLPRGSLRGRPAPAWSPRRASASRVSELGRVFSFTAAPPAAASTFPAPVAPGIPGGSRGQPWDPLMARAGSGGWWRSARRRVSRAVAVDPADADADRIRLELLVRVGELSNLELDTATRLEALLDAMLPHTADACAIFLVDDDHLHLTGARHVDPTRATHLGDPTLRGPFRITGSHPTARPCAPGSRCSTHRPRTAAATVCARSVSVRCSPCRCCGVTRRSARSCWPSSPPGRRSDPTTSRSRSSWRRRVTLSLDTGHRLEQERQIAETLQEHLLPRGLPHTVGLQLAGRYVGATRGIYVGGDWYDAVALGDGRVAVAIGDVVGHGLAAANAMGRLRAGLHLCMIDGLGPAEALERLNRYAFSFEESEMATVQVGIARRRTRDVPVRERGPPPAARRRRPAMRGCSRRPRCPTPRARRRDVRRRRGDAARRTPPCSLYTDGLVERRGESLTVGTGATDRHRVDARSTGLDDALDNLLEEFVPGGGDGRRRARRGAPRPSCTLARGPGGARGAVGDPACTAHLAHRSRCAHQRRRGPPGGGQRGGGERRRSTRYDDGTGTLRVDGHASDDAVTIS